MTECPFGSETNTHTQMAFDLSGLSIFVICLKASSLFLLTNLDGFVYILHKYEPNYYTSCQLIVSDKTPLATGENLTIISFISPRTYMPGMGQQVNKE